MPAAGRGVGRVPAGLLGVPGAPGRGAAAAGGAVQPGDAGDRVRGPGGRPAVAGRAARGRAPCLPGHRAA
ncbi:hypothetical protein DMH15_24935 [Streptomyces sp. WAC 06725]|nr:hypothetical protein DMH15_24935 [Streptomyces sp. WAC 06725]